GVELGAQAVDQRLGGKALTTDAIDQRRNQRVEREQRTARDVEQHARFIDAQLVQVVLHQIQDGTHGGLLRCRDCGGQAAPAGTVRTADQGSGGLFQRGGATMTWPSPRSLSPPCSTSATTLRLPTLLADMRRAGLGPAS